MIIITNPDIGIGFKLAGVEVVEADTKEEAKEKLASYFSDENIGLIAIDENFFAHVDERTKEAIEKAYRPVVISIPSKKTMISKEKRGDYLVKMIRRAIGYNITLRG